MIDGARSFVRDRQLHRSVSALRDAADEPRPLSHHAAPMLSARLKADSALEATLTPRQRTLLGSQGETPAGGAAAGVGRELGRHRSQPGSTRSAMTNSDDDGHRSGRSERGQPPSTDRSMRRFESAETGLKPLPPPGSRSDGSRDSPRKAASGTPPGKNKVYKDNRLGFEAGTQRQTLEEILGSYQENQSALEDLQRDLKGKNKKAKDPKDMKLPEMRRVLRERGLDDSGKRPEVLARLQDAVDAEEKAKAKKTAANADEGAVSMSHQKVIERQMYGLDDSSRAKVKKILLLDPEKRTAAQVKDLVEWTMDIDIFYGLTEQQRTQMCSVALEAQTFKEGDVVLKMGDSHSGVHVLFQGKCAIYLDRSNNKANESTDRGDRSPRASDSQQQKAKRDQGEKSPRAKERERQDREVSFSKYIEDSAKSRQRHVVRKRFALSAAKSIVDEDTKDGGRNAMHAVSFRSRKVASLGLDMHSVGGNRARRNAIGGDSTLPPVQVCFLAGDDIGGARAFHNVDALAVQKEGYRTASHTVQATEETLSVSVSPPDILLMLSAVHKRNIDEKVAFLKSLPSYKGCSDASLLAMSQLMKRKWFPAEATVVQEGDEAESVCFCVDGQLKVVKHFGKPKEKVLNVLGPGATFGDWGVVNDMPRAASMVTVTNAEILVIVRTYI